MSVAFVHYDLDDVFDVDDVMDMVMSTEPPAPKPNVAKPTPVLVVTASEPVQPPRKPRRGLLEFVEDAPEETSETAEQPVPPPVAPLRPVVTSALLAAEAADQPAPTASVIDPDDEDIDRLGLFQKPMPFLMPTAIVAGPASRPNRDRPPAWLTKLNERRDINSQAAMAEIVGRRTAAPFRTEAWRH